MQRAWGPHTGPQEAHSRLSGWHVQRPLGQQHTGHAWGQEGASAAGTKHHGRLAGGEVTGSHGAELGSKASGRCWGWGWGSLSWGDGATAILLSECLMTSQGTRITAS